MKPIAIGLTIACLCTCNSAFAERYRYKNAQGLTSITTQLSQEHINAGYQILDDNMHVVQVIPPFSEKSSMQSVQNNQRQLQQLKSDKDLLRTYYSSVRAEQQYMQKLNDLNNRISSAMLSRDKYIAQRIQLINQAGKYEKLEKPIAPHVLANLKMVNDEIKLVNNNIQVLTQNKALLTAEFNRIISRLKQLEANK